MEFQFIKSFISVVEHGAITEASNQLNVTQPALSRRIQQFERQMGADLLVRGRKGVVLTEAGRLVYQECRILMSRFEQLKSDVGRLVNLEGGVIRLGGGATAVSFMLPVAIAGFQKRYPDIHFQLKEAGSAEIAHDVLTGALEVGVVTLPVQSSDLVVTPLGTDRIVLVGRHDHPLVGAGSVSLEEISGHSFVGFEAGSAIRQIIDNTLRDAGVEMNVVMELRSIPAILSMVSTTGNLEGRLVAGFLTVAIIVLGGEGRGGDAVALDSVAVTLFSTVSLSFVAPILTPPQYLGHCEKSTMHDKF